MKEGIEAFGQILEMLADKLGVTAEYLIPLFARQQIGYAVAQLLCIIGIGAAWWYRVRRWGDGEDCGDVEEARIIRGVIGGAMLIICVMLLIEAAGTLASPQAAGIESILDAGGNLLHPD